MRMEMVMKMVILMIMRSSPPINEQTALTGLTNTALERHNVTGIKLLLLDETAPSFSHHIALAAVPVGVPKPPRLAVSVLEVEEEALAVFAVGGVQGEVPLGVLLWDDESVELAHIARSNHLVEHVLSLTSAT
ncbi:hypothetical protein PanWU01x14_230320 [Parasponia andersonii]|uniref:Uncharacterized protein n=1 Tax=Parasponia andersonii TaxID=3476 RepID=A0A2P5BKY7_PARAD|nr:hypothetical protein PanWU01x14_230320 [Parasponia andersonii]